MKTKDAVCIVTGASSGIGAATARRLGHMGATTVLAARRSDRLASLAGELPRALAVPTDVTDRSQIGALVERTLGEFGRVDVLVNCAGQGLHVPLEALDPSDLHAVFDLNVVGPLMAMQAVLPPMRAQGCGTIVNVSSATSLRVSAGLGGYGATKAALNMVSQVGRVEMAGAGVSVSVIYPSFTATEFPDHLRAGRMVSGNRTIPPDLPDLVARAVVFAIETGEAHVLVDDPPVAIVPGGDEWGALLARPIPHAARRSSPRRSGEMAVLAAMPPSTAADLRQVPAPTSDARTRRPA